MKPVGRLFPGNRLVAPRRRILCIATLCCLLGSLLFAPSLLAANADVRILIDVSGSMKQNDPKNLRVPALRLVNELLPAGSSAGVWTFAEKVENVAPPGPVDADWKARTRASLKRIHSRGQRTDIERAIDAALSGWEPQPDAQRHVVLLTDGLVDVSRDEAENSVSRQRILSTQLERLKELGVRVHAIALSDKVDTELLQILTERTGGWLESVNNADELQRVFLHMLEQSVAPTTVPLEGNAFEVDEQVSEFTLLAFHGVGTPVTLVSPNGKTFSATTVSPDLQWREEDGYELVTVQSPTPGQWRLKGDIDPDNRVAIVTDMGIEAKPLPGQLNSGDTLEIEAWLTDHGRAVERADLLQLLSARIELAGLEDPSIQLDQPLELDRETHRFKTEFKASALAPGTYQLRTLIDGVTFKRQLQQRLKVAPPPLTLNYEGRAPPVGEYTAKLRVILNAEPDLIDPETLFGYVKLTNPDGGIELLELGPPTELPMLYEMPIPAPGAYEASARVAVTTSNGRPILLEPKSEKFLFDFSLPETASAETDENGFDWLTFSLYVLGGNLLLAPLLGLTWWLLRRTKAAKTS